MQGNRSRMRAWMYAILITMISCHLRAERDLNYRYLAWRGGAAGPSPFLITGCARAFQESDSRHNSVGSPGSIFTLPSTVPHFSPPTPPSLPFPSHARGMHLKKICRRIDPLPPFLRTCPPSSSFERNLRRIQKI